MAPKKITKPKTTKPARKKLRVLLLEDDNLDAQLLMLALRPHKVDHFVLAEESLKHIENPYDLFLVDLNLPDYFEDGISFAKKVIQKQPEAVIVFLSNYYEVFSDKDIKETHALGIFSKMDDKLGKKIHNFVKKLSEGEKDTKDMYYAIDYQKPFSLRERQVFALLKRGYPRKKVAAFLNSSCQYVAQVIERINLKKLLKK